MAELEQRIEAATAALEREAEGAFRDPSDDGVLRGLSGGVEETSPRHRR